MMKGICGITSVVCMCSGCLESRAAQHHCNVLMAPAVLPLTTITNTPHLPTSPSFLSHTPQTASCVGCRVTLTLLRRSWQSSRQKRSESTAKWVCVCTVWGFSVGRAFLQGFSHHTALAQLKAETERVNRQVCVG